MQKHKLHGRNGVFDIYYLIRSCSFLLFKPQLVWDFKAILKLMNVPHNSFPPLFRLFMRNQFLGCLLVLMFLPLFWVSCYMNGGKSNFSCVKGNLYMIQGGLNFEESLIIGNYLLSFLMINVELKFKRGYV